MHKKRDGPGGLGLRSAVRLTPAAYWASRADALKVLSHREPVFTEGLLGSHQGQGPFRCGQQVDQCGDHALAGPRTKLLARRAKTVERAWVRLAREAVGSEASHPPTVAGAHSCTGSAG